MKEIKVVPKRLRIKCYELALKIYKERLDYEIDNQYEVSYAYGLCSNFAGILRSLNKRDTSLIRNLSIEFPELAPYKPTRFYLYNRIRDNQNSFTNREFFSFWFNSVEKRIVVLELILKDIKK